MSPKTPRLTAIAAGLPYPIILNLPSGKPLLFAAFVNEQLRDNLIKYYFSDPENKVGLIDWIVEQARENEMHMRAAGEWTQKNDKIIRQLKDAIDAVEKIRDHTCEFSPWRAEEDEQPGPCRICGLDGRA